jgi:hypothetical protein
MFDYPFTEEDMAQTNEEWGASCGPISLAFALQVPLQEVREAIPGFEEKRHTTPTMMRAALEKLQVGYDEIHFPGYHFIPRDMFDERIAICRIQWTGPWTALGANPKWSYKATHWIACWRQSDEFEIGRVFDCNSGIKVFTTWDNEIVPALTVAIPRADGGWFPTHIWRLHG